VACERLTDGEAAAPLRASNVEVLWVAEPTPPGEDVQHHRDLFKRAGEFVDKVLCEAKPAAARCNTTSRSIRHDTHTLRWFSATSYFG
jgi:hypothetical protein